MDRQAAREKAVLNWIAENFEPEAVRVEPFDLFPHGRRVIDAQGGEMIVFWDLATNTVKYEFPQK